MIYLVRHGQTEWNVAGRMQGQLDSPLTRKGVAQARAVGRRLRQELSTTKSVRLISSPMGRAMSTAGIVANVLEIEESEIAPEPLLAEMHWGDWQGYSHAEVEEKYPGAQAERERNRWDFVVPGGESYAFLFQRGSAWLNTLRAGETIVAVAHEMISRTIRGAYCRLTPDEMMQLRHRQDRIYVLRDGESREIVAG